MPHHDIMVIGAGSATWWDLSAANLGHVDVETELASVADGIDEVGGTTYFIPRAAADHHRSFGSPSRWPRRRQVTPTPLR
jgi:hypothetical protein